MAEKLGLRLCDNIQSLLTYTMPRTESSNFCRKFLQNDLTHVKKIRSIIRLKSIKKLFEIDYNNTPLIDFNPIIHCKLENEL